MATKKNTSKSRLSDEDLKLLNSKQGLRVLFSQPEINPQKAVRRARYEQRLVELQIELVRMQTWVIENRKKVTVLFEGRDAAGKGGAIRRFTHRINPRHSRVVALSKPTEDERGQWYFQRYVNQLPRPGEIVFFDRSWYNRAIVEPVNGFCTDEEYKVFMSQVNAFEEMLVQSNTTLIKLYFSISKEEQARRFREIQADPRKRWKITPVDLRAQELWAEYTKYKRAMFDQTHTKHAPWKVISANQKSDARLAAMEHVLANIPYKRKSKRK